MENQNSVDKHQKTVWELLSDKWNDQFFAPETKDLPDLHPDFVDTEMVDHTLVCQMTPADPKKCKEKWSGMMLELTRVVANWEQSRQGNGGIRPDDNPSDNVELSDRAQYGSLRNQDSEALDCLSCFLDCSASYILYFWHVLDKHDLLQSSLHQLDEEGSAGNGGKGVPSVIMQCSENVDGYQQHHQQARQDEPSTL